MGSCAVGIEVSHVVCRLTCAKSCYREHWKRVNSIESLLKVQDGVPVCRRETWEGPCQAGCSALRLLSSHSAQQCFTCRWAEAERAVQLLENSLQDKSGIPALLELAMQAGRTHFAGKVTRNAVCTASESVIIDHIYLGSMAKSATGCQAVLQCHFGTAQGSLDTMQICLEQLPVSSVFYPLHSTCSF